MTPSTFNAKLLWTNRTLCWTLGLLVVLFLLCFLGPFFSPYSSDTLSDVQFSPPSAKHWLGTDINGRDVLTMTLEGGRISLLVGIVGASISLVIGTCYGIISGYIGGKTDMIMMRIVDTLFSLPRIIIIMLIIAVCDHYTRTLLENTGMPGLIQYSRIILLFATLGLVQWLTMARIVRGQVLSLKERQFVLASQAMGRSHFGIMFRHLLPNLMGIIIVYLTLTIPTVILEEAFLSFLGLGVQAPQASWGTLLKDGADMINPIKIYWWLLAAPALFMGLTLLSLNFLGDALRDIFDPMGKR